MGFQTGLHARALILTVAITVLLTDRTNGYQQRNNIVVPVEKGRITDLAPVLDRLLASHVTTSPCNITVLDTGCNSCGAIRPDVFSCSQLSSRQFQVLYTHLGCPASLQVLRFRVSSGGNVSRLKLIANITRSTHRLAAVEKNLVVNTMPEELPGLYSIHLSFSSDWLDVCYYALALYPGLLPLPQHGDLIAGADTNKLLSCGYVSQQPFLYEQHVVSQQQQQPLDYVILLFTEGGSDDPQHIIVPLQLSNYSHNNVQSYPDISLIVRHTGLSPLDGESFRSHFHNLSGSLQFHIKGQGGIFVTDGLFEEDDTGLSVFTSKGLLANAVSFHPTQPSEATVRNGSAGELVFSVSVLDVAGSLVAVSSLRVHLNRPAAVQPLTLVVSGFVYLDVLPSLRDSVSGVNLTLDCLHILTGQPESGVSVGRLSGGEENSLLLTQSEFESRDVIVYVQRDESVLRYGWFHWSVLCNGQMLDVTVYVVMADLHLTSSPRLCYSASSVDVIEGHANQLYGVMLQSSSVFGNDWDLTYSVSSGEHSVLLTNDSQISGPFLSALDLLSSPNVSPTDSFTQEDLDRGLVWYIPGDVGDGFSLHLEGSSPTEQINIDTRPVPFPTSNQLKSTYDPVALSPLLLSPSDQSVALGPSNIQCTDKDVFYVVRIEPVWGKLCASGDPCETSKKWFSQKEVDLGLVHYVSNGINFQFDAFAFTLSTSISSIVHWMVVERSLSPLESVERKYTGLHAIEVSVHGEQNVSLPESILPNFLLLPGPQDAASIYVVRNSKYGRLSEPYLFTVNQLVSGSIQYIPFSQPFCADELLLAVVLGNITLELPLVKFLYQGSDSAFIPLSVDSVKNFGHPSVLLDLLDIQVLHLQCDFAATRVRILQAPKFGDILLGSSDSSNATYHLIAGSEFSLEDVVLGIVGYEIHAQFVTSGEPVDDSFSLYSPLTASVPVYTLSLHYVTDSSQPVYHFDFQLHRPHLYVSSIGPGMYGADIGASFLSVVVMPHPAPKSTVLCFENKDLFRIQCQSQTTASSPLSGMETHPTATDCFSREALQHSLCSLVLDPSKLASRSNTTEESVSLQAKVLHTSGALLSLSGPFNIPVRWTFVYFQSRQSSLAEKTTLFFQVSLRRSGELGVTSSFELAVVGGNAINDCNNSANGDVCVETFPVVMAPGVREAEFVIEIYPDSENEGTESLVLEIVNTVNAIPLPGSEEMVITIADNPPDPTILQFSIPNSRPSSNPVCDLEVTVSEDVGIFEIPIVQIGVSRGSVGIICYTEDLERIVWPEERDYVERKNEPESLIQFDRSSHPRNESTAICPITIVNDTHHEFEESFVVILGEVIGNAEVNRSANRLCVHISNDLTPEASVGFAESRASLILSEDQSTAQVLPVRIIRTGSPEALSLETTVRFALLKWSNGTGQAGVNFLVSPNVTFEPNATVAVVNVLVLNVVSISTLRIGIESVENGVRAMDGQIVEILVIPPEVAIVEFEFDALTVKETDEVRSLPVSRRGNLNVAIIIECIQHDGDAEAGTDFHSKSTSINLGPKSKTAFCTFEPIDDSMWEGFERLRYSLEIVEGYAVLGDRDEATITITDFEDAPTVQFTTGNKSEVEPLSQFEVDETNVTVWLERTGDPVVQFQVRYYIESGNGSLAGIAGVDYEAVEGIALFEPHVTSFRIDIRLISNRQRNEDFQFTVRVAPLPQSIDSVRLGENKTVSVYVENRVLKGSYFPANPRIAERRGIGFRDTLSAYKPLLCITPCDPEWKGDDEHKLACKNQHIDHQFTKYTWEMTVEKPSNPASTSREEFVPISFENILVTPHQRYLDPVYMFPDRYIRCRVTAVDESNVGGYSRVSDPVRLVHTPQEACSVADDVSLLRVTAKLSSTSDEGHTLNLNNVLSLTLSNILHFDNQIPLVSTSPFPRDVTPLLTFTPARRQHGCSNLNFQGFHSLAGTRGGWRDRPLSVYEQLDYTTCHWQFKSYHKIGNLLQVCGGTLNQEGGVTIIKVPIYLTYVHITPWDVVPERAYSTNTTAVFEVPLHLFTNSATESSGPVERILNTTQENRSSLRVLSTSVRRSLLSIVLETELNSSKEEYFVPGIPLTSHASLVEPEFEGVFSLDLLQTMSPGTSTRQIWKITSLTTLPDYSGEFKLKLVRCKLLYRVACSFTGTTQFRFQIERNESVNSNYMHSVRISVKQNGTEDRSYIIGDVLEFSAKIAEGQVLSPGIGVRVLRADLCLQSQGRGRRNCLQGQSVKVSLNSLPSRTIRQYSDDHSPHLPQSQSYSLYVPTISLTKGRWNIDIRYALVNEKDEIVFDGPEGMGYMKTDQFNLLQKPVHPSLSSSGTPSTEIDPTTMILTVSLSTIVGLLLAAILIIAIAILCFCKLRQNQRQQAAVSPQAVRRQANVKVQYHGVASKTTLESGVERLECVFELLKFPPEVTSLPEMTMTTPSAPGRKDKRSRGKRRPSSNDSCEEVGSSSSQSHKSLPVPLPWAGIEMPPVLVRREFDSSFPISMGTEAGMRMAEATEAYLAAMAQSPKDSQANQETNL